MVSGFVCVWRCVGWEEEGEGGGVGRGKCELQSVCHSVPQEWGGGGGSITWSVGLNVFGGAWGVKRRREDSGREVWATKCLLFGSTVGVGGGGKGRGGLITWSVDVNGFGGVWGVKRRRGGLGERECGLQNVSRRLECVDHLIPQQE